MIDQYIRMADSLAGYEKPNLNKTCRQVKSVFISEDQNLK